MGWLVWSEPTLDTALVPLTEYTPAEPLEGLEVADATSPAIEVETLAPEIPDVDFVRTPSSVSELEATLFVKEVKEP